VRGGALSGQRKTVVQRVHLALLLGVCCGLSEVAAPSVRGAAVLRPDKAREDLEAAQG
jgi:hypothetical protein